MLFLWLAAPAFATDVQVIGLYNGKAVLVINSGKPKTLREGETGPEGVKLLSADRERAVVQIGGTRRTLTLGQGVYAAAPSSSSSTSSMVVLTADNRGHYTVDGNINGASVRFLVDTGATMVTFSSGEAKRLGVNYFQGERGVASTANGLVSVYRVKLDEVRVGDISLRNVDALVQEGDGLPMALLGMSFLNRVEMRQNSGSLTLRKRF